MIYKIIKPHLFFGILITVKFALAETPIESTAKLLCEHIFNSENYKYEDLFSKTFTDKIPESRFRFIIGETIEATGRCADPQKMVVTEKGADYRFASKSGNYLDISFSLDNERRINSFMIIDLVLPNVVINSWNEAVSRLNSFNGKTALTISHFDGSSKELRSREMQPLGSGFKLYVLSALSDAVNQGVFHWQDQFPITEKWKSLPAEGMQKWPNGQMVSLYDYARYMIAKSDNTATDHLLNIVGRKQVEEQLNLLKNDFIQENKPFLSSGWRETCFRAILHKFFL